jgi:hypothetical protein
MKITAEFDSIDTADVVAASLRHQIAGMADIKVLNPELTDHGSERTFQGFAPGYSNSTGGAAFGMSTAGVLGINNFEDNTPPDNRSKAVKLQLICRKDDAQLAKRIMIGYGGRDLRGS